MHVEPPLKTLGEQRAVSILIQIINPPIVGISGTTSFTTGATMAKNLLTQSLLKTSVIKDLRQQKEKAKHRKSMLIYGTNDMKKKLFEREQRK